jgi:hypothetical protein
VPSVRLRPRSGGLAERLGYRLDRFLALHPAWQLLAVLLWATLLALAFGAVSLVFADDPSTDADGGLWWAITRMLDGGTVASDSGLGRRFVGVSVTLVGMVLVAVVTGAFASSFADRMRDIRRGTFSIFERRHALLLGYGTHGDVILRELAGSGIRATVVIVSNQDREIIEERAREAVAHARHRLRVIIRRADPTTTGGVRLAAGTHARAVVILPEIDRAEGRPAHDQPECPYGPEDRATMRALLAARRVLGGRKVPLIVESTGDHGRELIELSGKNADLTLVEEGDVSTHLLVHSVRQPGVLDVVRDILNLSATSVYEHPAGAFAGKTFDEAHALIEPGVLVGLLRRRKHVVCPPGGTRVEAQDRLLVLANDNAGLLASGKLPPAPAAAPGRLSGAAKEQVHVLVIGYRRGLSRILRSLRTHCAARITLLAPPEHAAQARAALDASGFPAAQAELLEGASTDAAALARALAAGPTRLLLLAADAGDRDPADVDADQIVTLLHARHVAGGAHVETPALVEVHTAETERLVDPHPATDFILMREITGMLLAQELHAICLDETAGAWLGEAFLLLLNDISTRIWLHPLDAYVPDVLLPSFADVLVAARRRGEVALGVRRARSRPQLLPGREERFDPRDTDVVVIAAPEPSHVHEPHANERKPRAMA